MKYTYKEDTFWGDWRNNRTIVAGMVVILLSVLLIKDAKPVALIMGIIGVIAFMVGIIDAKKRLKRNFNRRMEMMKNGCRSTGKIVDAGGKTSLKIYYTGHRDENNNRTRVNHWVSNWWIDVEYYSEEVGTYKRFRAQHMNKNGKLHRIIGKEVEVYTYDGFVYVRVPD